MYTLNGITQSDKIDAVATQGLNGVHGSLAYELAEVEYHFHHYSRWFELASVPAAETHRADAAGLGAGAFQIDAGNNTWGSWVQILGSSDTPVATGSAYFDMHEILVTATEKNFLYVLQIGFGASGAAALTAGDYIEEVFLPAAAFVDSGPVGIHSIRIATGTKAWARCLCDGQDTGTFNFLFGIHEYEG